MTAIAKAPALTLPSEITEPGWYWAEERIEAEYAPPPGLPDGFRCTPAKARNDYQLTALHVDDSIDGVLRFAVDGANYDAAAADAWFRIIRRIEEPELRGGWA